MKIILLGTVLAVGAISGCSTAANNANLRGANTNTGYVTNSTTNAKPAITSNVTNVSPGNVTGSAPATNANSSH